MATRAVIEIDEEKCDGCGLCANGCHEGALRIIDGKARLVGESLCDGLGACIGDCPRGALTTVYREVEAYDERRVIEHILPKGMATIAAHLDHLASHGQDTWYAQALEVLKEKGLSLPSSKPEQSSGCGCGEPASPRYSSAPVVEPGLSPRIVNNGMTGTCPGSAARVFSALKPTNAAPTPVAAQNATTGGSMASRLSHWPIQLHLVNPRSPHFSGADILIAADCTAFACGAFHQGLLAGKKLVIACPKLDTGKEIYVDKIRALINDSQAASITLAIMDVPCCGGLKRLLDEAMAGATRPVPVSTVIVGQEGGSLTWL